MKSVLLLVTLVAGTHLLFAQQLTPSVLAIAGGSDAAVGIHLDWTLGELATTADLDGAFPITEGFHQPRLRVEEFPVTATPERPNVRALPELEVFPNPTVGELTIRTDSDTALRFTLTDIAGKLVLTGDPDTTVGTRTLSVADLTPGTYLLNCFDQEGQLLRNFRIIKL